MRLFVFICFIAFAFSEQQNKVKPFSQKVQGTDITIKMVPVKTEDGLFWISRTEVSWDLYDTFLNIVNSPDNLNSGVDAITGPTPAYALVDRGYGHLGYPAISMSAKAASSFCDWLSKVTDRKYSIPTIEQWIAANVEGGTAWHKENAEKTTRPIATSEPNSLGIFDLRGNVGEWVSTKEGLRVIGGSFRTPPQQLGQASLLTPTNEWNQTDPQLPRSEWWLADADFVGMRLVTEDGEADE
ncbi:SUMF1/EgtB/PvdO family nonheme iron enzyme [PVC group bacterium]|nr:SUMF1/EgtB/PvdO family nonheme iron enzyme [PVC group bacterium]